MPRKTVDLARGQTLLRALKLSIDETEDRKRRAAAAAAPERRRRPRSKPMIELPPPPAPESDDESLGLELVVSQVLELLVDARAASTDGVCRMPDKQVDWIYYALSHELCRRKKAA